LKSLARAPEVAWWGVPWCDDCSKFYDRSGVDAGGKCPSCGTVIVKARPSAPWHFKVLLAGLAGYMIYRVYWLAEWLPKHL
jgi:DNA-directed RNA polymerase subunit RPC12/RpoP